jgi:organic radical activating enzyme
MSSAIEPPHFTSLPDSWCPYPFHYVMITPNLDVRPCCRYNKNNDTEKMTLQSLAEITNILNGPTFSSLRKQLNMNKKPSGCATCFREEESGIHSLRQKTIYEETLPNNSKVQLTSLEIGVGRTCNLKCRTCNSQYSTKWDHDEKALGWKNDFFTKDYDADLENFPTDLFSRLTEVKITGGEPFLNKSLDIFLENFINSGFAKNCSLEIFTNGTLFPAPKTLNFLSQFKHCRISLSIDGLAEKNDYIRHPSQWESILNNARQWHTWQKTSANHTLWIANTVCVFNIADCFSFLAWADSFFGLKSKVVFQILHGPSYLSVYKLPNSVKKSIIDKLQQEMDGSLSHLNTEKHFRNINKIFSLLTPHKNDSPLGFKKEFLKHTQQLDSLRNENFSVIFPELNHWIQQC